ncbi:MAG: IS5 family transposase [Acidimicrobiales bacterium]
MRALDPQVKAIVWEAFEPLIPVPVDQHPLGRHRRRKADRLAFEVMITRIATGCSWEDAERLCGNQISDTTARSRRDEWVEAGIYERLVNEALLAFDKVIGLQFGDVAADGSLHKAPAGGVGTGKSPVDRSKRGWKWHILTDLGGIPFGWVADGANRNDSILLEPTLLDAERRGWLSQVTTIWLDRGYDSDATRERLAAFGIDDAVIAKKRKRGSTGPTPRQPMGLRWQVERTNSWLSNFGQLRRNTDRKPEHRLAQLALAIVFIITAKLIDWRKRWVPDLSPIR